MELSPESIFDKLTSKNQAAAYLVRGVGQLSNSGPALRKNLIKCFSSRGVGLLWLKLTKIIIYAEFCTILLADVRTKQTDKNDINTWSHAMVAVLNCVYTAGNLTALQSYIHVEITRRITCRLAGAQTSNSDLATGCQGAPTWTIR